MYLFSQAQEQALQLVYKAISSKNKKLQKGDVEIIETRDPSHGDLSCAIAFRLARDLRKPPKELAEEFVPAIRPEMKNAPLFSNVSALNGYINLSFSQEYFNSALKEITQKEMNFGTHDFGKSKKAIVEYSSPNIGKPMHIGHIRSTILGDAIAKVMGVCGYSVIETNYLCESGLQTAKLLLALQLFGKAKVETEKDLLELYVKIHKELEAKPELKKQADELVKQMELGSPEVLKQLSKVRKLSTKPFDTNYALLGVEFKEQVFDSDYVLEGKKLVDEALGKDVAFRDAHGEIVANLEAIGLPNLIVLRSNGTSLYSTRDLGLAERDYRKYKFDKRVYVTASDQNLHFKQVFAILKALNKPYAENLTHIGFGLISLEEGKLSTRIGRVILLEEVLNDAVAVAFEEVRKRQQYSENDAREIAKKVGIAAMKYSVLKVSAEKDIKFSFKDAVRFDGNTASYLQYTAVRARNILRKAKAEKDKTLKSKNIQTKYEFKEEEKYLIRLLSQYPQTLAHACNNLSPYIICDYLFKLALQFSTFYDKCPVLKAESIEARDARLRIVNSLGITIENGLKTLGINVPSKM